MTVWVKAIQVTNTAQIQ